MRCVAASQPRALGGKVAARSQMAGREELLKGAVRKSELAFAVLLALAEQQAGSRLDVVDDDGGLVEAVVEQWAEGTHQPAFADVGRAFGTDALRVHLEGEPPQHVAHVRKPEARHRERFQQCLVGADALIPARQQQLDGLAVEVGAVFGKPAAAMGVQRRHQREQQRVARERVQFGPVARAQQVVGVGRRFAR